MCNKATIYLACGHTSKFQPAIKRCNAGTVARYEVKGGLLGTKLEPVYNECPGLTESDTIDTTVICAHCRAQEEGRGYWGFQPRYPDSTGTEK